MDLFFYIALSFAAAVIVTAIAVEAFQRGWLRVTTTQHEEIDVLREKINKLEIILEAVREERDLLQGELVMAHRLISSLESRVDDTEKKLREREKVRVLAIWPAAPTLDQQSERNAIYNAGFEYNALRGPHASKPHILRELRRNGYIILEIGAHGTEDGTIYLHDGEVLPGWWQRILSDRHIRIAVLLACYTDMLADAILRAGVQFVIATTGQIEDNAAILFAREFYSSYADGVDVEKATDNARLILPLNQSEMIVLRKSSSTLSIK